MGASEGGRESAGRLTGLTKLPGSLRKAPGCLSGAESEALSSGEHPASRASQVEWQEAPAPCPLPLGAQVPDAPAAGAQLVARSCWDGGWVPGCRAPSVTPSAQPGTARVLGPRGQGQGPGTLLREVFRPGPGGAAPCPQSCQPPRPLELSPSGREGGHWGLGSCMPAFGAWRSAWPRKAALLSELGPRLPGERSDPPAVAGSVRGAQAAEVAWPGQDHRAICEAQDKMTLWPSRNSDSVKLVTLEPVRLVGPQTRGPSLPAPPALLLLGFRPAPAPPGLSAQPGKAGARARGSLRVS